MTSLEIDPAVIYTVICFIFFVKNFRVQKMHENYFHKCDYATYIHVQVYTIIHAIWKNIFVRFSLHGNYFVQKNFE